MADRQHYTEMYNIYQDIQTLMKYHSEIDLILKEMNDKSSQEIDTFKQIELCSSAILEVCDKIGTNVDREKGHCSHCCCNQN